MSSYVMALWYFGVEHSDLHCFSGFFFFSYWMLYWAKTVLQVTFTLIESVRLGEQSAVEGIKREFKTTPTMMSQVRWGLSTDVAGQGQGNGSTFHFDHMEFEMLEGQWECRSPAEKHFSVTGAQEIALGWTWKLVIHYHCCGFCGNWIFMYMDFMAIIIYIIIHIWMKMYVAKENEEIKNRTVGHILI